MEVTLFMIKSFEGNNQGEICSFSAEKAEALKEAKIARDVTDEERKKILDDHHHHKAAVLREKNRGTSPSTPIDAPKGYKPPVYDEAGQPIDAKAAAAR